MSRDRLMLAALDRKARRNWARGLGSGSVMIEEATAKVAEVFAEQWSSASSACEPGEALIIGLLSLEEVFGSLVLSIKQVNEAISRAGEDHRASIALSLLDQLDSSTKAYSGSANWKRDRFLGLQNEPARPKGPSKFKNVHRNMLIVNQIKQLVTIGFRPTRSSATEGPASGCDIVAQATHRIDGGYEMTYAAAEYVWKNRSNAPSLQNIGSEFINACVSALEQHRRR